MMARRDVKIRNPRAVSGSALAGSGRSNDTHVIRSPHSTQGAGDPAHVLISEALDDLAVRSIERMLDVEARLLAGGFHDPFVMYNLAYQCHVSTAAFAEPNHRILFGLLLNAAELGFEPTVAELRRAAEKHGALWADAGYPTDLERILCRESGPLHIEYHMRLVADCARRREEARTLIAQATSLLEGILLPSRPRIPTRKTPRKESRCVPIRS